MRKLTSILLLACLCCALFGYHLFFHFQIAAVKAEMKAFLRNQKEHKDVVRISLNKQESDQLAWENENEFRYKGEMYDVIEKKVEGNRLIVRCLPDNKETALLMEYQKTNKKHSSDSLAVQLITAPFILPSPYCIQQPEPILNKNFPSYSSSLQKIASPVFLPPPDAC